MKLVINKVRKNGLEEVILYFKPGGKIYRIVFFIRIEMCFFTCIKMRCISLQKKKKMTSVQFKKKSKTERGQIVFSRTV